MIFQTSLPYDVFEQRPLPGIAPLRDAPWFLVDDAYAAQMSRRRALIADHTSQVIAEDAPDRSIKADLLEEALAHLPMGFRITRDAITCPDGHVVAIDRDAPLHTLGQVLQEDICLLEKRGDEHVLTGAVLCFPASWTLSEKIGHPLTDIHVPVEDYDAQLARRVQRLFDGVRHGHALWRFNALWYDDPELFQPRSASDPRPLTSRETGSYLRSERQVIWRLPRSAGVVFTVHTYVLPRDRVGAPFPAQETA